MQKINKVDAKCATVGRELCVLLLNRPRAGLAAAAVTMAVSLAVNWVFPTFEYGINLVLIGLTQFGLFVFAVTPWLWADADRNAEDPEFGRAKRRQNN